MFELLTLGLVAVAVMAAVGLVAMLLWLVLLPFRMLAFIFKGLLALLFLPFFALIGLVIAALVGIPLLFVVLLPLAPVALLFVFIWWLAKRGVQKAAPAP